MPSARRSRTVPSAARQAFGYGVLTGTQLKIFCKTYADWFDGEVVDPVHEGLVTVEFVFPDGVQGRKHISPQSFADVVIFEEEMRELDPEMASRKKREQTWWDRTCDNVANCFIDNCVYQDNAAGAFYNNVAVPCGPKTVDAVAGKDWTGKTRNYGRERKFGSMYCGGEVTDRRMAEKMATAGCCGAAVAGNVVAGQALGFSTCGEGMAATHHGLESVPYVGGLAGHLVPDQFDPVGPFAGCAKNAGIAFGCDKSGKGHKNDHQSHHSRERSRSESKHHSRAESRSHSRADNSRHSKADSRSHSRGHTKARGRDDRRFSPLTYFE